MARTKKVKNTDIVGECNMKTYEELALENRIAKLQSSQRPNANIVRKAERNLRLYRERNAR